MSVEDDVALFSRVPILNLLGPAALNVLAIGAEYRNVEFGQDLFRIGDESDCGYVVKRGAFRVSGPERDNETIAAVVPLPAHHRDAALGKIGIQGFERGDDLAAGVLHQDQRGETNVLDGAAIGLAHLLRVQDAHRSEL